MTFFKTTIKHFTPLSCRGVGSGTLFLLCALSSPAVAQVDESAWSFSLDSITVSAWRDRRATRDDAQGATVWDMRRMDEMPQVFGTADPIRLVQMLPGVQTNSEYRSGINIQGCDNQHNRVTIDGVTVWNVNHLLGLYSTFNAEHFATARIARGVTGAASANHLGGTLAMETAGALADSTRITLDAGLIATSGTAQWVLGRRTSATISLRESHVNLLYSNWLKADGEPLRYRFHDANVTLRHELNGRNALQLDFYNGADVAHFQTGATWGDLRGRWGNTLAALHWNCAAPSAKIRTTAYVTEFRNRLRLDMPDGARRLPNGICDLGLKTELTGGWWSGGAELVRHDLRGNGIGQKRATEGALWVDGRVTLANDLRLDAGLRSSIFVADGTPLYALDPSLHLRYDNGTWMAAATLATRHQFLHQGAFSDCGLPTDFWFVADGSRRAQRGTECTLSGAVWLAERRSRLAADVFLRRLAHQLTYDGSLFDFVTSANDIDAHLLHGRGTNHGASLTLHKCAGRLTGWATYTFTRARRRFDAAHRPSTYPAHHERPHEMNLVATYAPTRHWQFSATAVYASGTPFTPARALAIINTNVIVTYGDYNSARLKPYARLDLAGSYLWQGRRGLSHAVNVSLYNATGRDNELFYYLRTRSDGSFAYRPVRYVMRALPSVSYKLKM